MEATDGSLVEGGKKKKKSFPLQLNFPPVGGAGDRVRQMTYGENSILKYEILKLYEMKAVGSLSTPQFSVAVAS